MDFQAVNRGQARSGLSQSAIRVGQLLWRAGGLLSSQSWSARTVIVFCTTLA